MCAASTPLSPPCVFFGRRSGKKEKRFALPLALNLALTQPSQDSAKSSQYCGDVAYVAALLNSFGFAGGAAVTMTNKIRDVELVWTLGAMLAKCAPRVLVVIIVVIVVSGDSSRI